MKQRLLVCGGRDYRDREMLDAVLDRAHAANPITALIHGACHLGGADILADEWAKKHGIPTEPYPVDHAVDGPWPGAGPKRNARMLAASKPDIVVAFPGDRGTRNMMALAKAANVPVVPVKPRRTVLSFGGQDLELT